MKDKNEISQFLKFFWDDPCSDVEFDDMKVHDNGIVEYSIGDDFDNDMLGIRKVLSDVEAIYSERVSLEQGKVFFEVQEVWSNH